MTQDQKEGLGLVIASLLIVVLVITAVQIVRGSLYREAVRDCARIEILTDYPARINELNCEIEVAPNVWVAWDDISSDKEIAK